MALLMVVSFISLFALSMMSIGGGLAWVERKRKQQVFAALDAIGKSRQQVDLLLPAPGEQTAIESLLARFDFTKSIQMQINQADVNWTVQSFLIFTGVAAIAGLVVGIRLMAGLLAPLGGALVLGVLPLLMLRRKRTKRLNALEAQVPEALDFLARSMRAGHALTVSIGMLGTELPEPIGREFRTLFNEQNLGAPFHIALENLCERVPVLDLRFFASALMLQRQTGGNLGEILGRLSAVIRERFRLRGQVKALSAHGRMTASILTGLPIVTSILLTLVAPTYLKGMWDDPDGKNIVIGSVVLVVLGSLLMQKIVKIKV